MTIKDGFKLGFGVTLGRFAFKSLGCAIQLLNERMVDYFGIRDEYEKNIATLTKRNGKKKVECKTNKIGFSID